MKKLLASCLLSLPFMATATDYHFSSCDTGIPALAIGTVTTPAATCVQGDNTTGTGTAANPWRNIKGFFNAGLAVRTLPAGSRFLLARGSVWYASWPRVVLLSNTSTTAEPFTVDTYTPPAGSGADALPLIIPNGAIATADCTAICGRMFDIQGVASRKGTEAYVIRNIRIHGFRDVNFVSYIDPVTGKKIETANEPRVNGQWGISINGGTGLLIENMDIRGVSLGIEGMGGATATSRYLIIRNNTLSWNGQGMHGAYIHALIENNTISNNAGNGGALVHNVYFGNIQHSIFRNNTVENNAIDPISGKCESISIVIHGTADNVVFENNLVRETNPSSNCFLIDVSPAYANPWLPPELFRNLVLRGNRFVNWGSYGVTFTSCNDCIVESNIFYKDTAPTSVCAICTPGSVAADATIHGTPSQDLVGNPRIHFRNNTVYIAAKGTQGITTGIRQLVNAKSGGGTGHSITNNVVIFAGTVSGRADCFNIGTPSPADFAAINNNLCWAIPAVTDLRWSTSMSLAVAQAAPYNYASVHLSSDPLLVATPNAANNYSMAVQIGSPTRNAGNATFRARLGFGSRVPVDATWIGAWPYGTTLIAPASPGRPRAR